MSSTIAPPVGGPASTGPGQVPSSDRGFFGHPRGLATLFFTEMWERFSYYGLRPLLVLFMAAALTEGGFGFDRADGGMAGLLFGLGAVAHVQAEHVRPGLEKRPDHPDIGRCGAERRHDLDIAVPSHPNLVPWAC